MGIYRNSVVLVQRLEAAGAVLDSGAYIVRPTDGDPGTDADQEFALFLYVEQVAGDGNVVVDVLTSFGDGVWANVHQKTLSQVGGHVLRYVPLEGFAPHLRVRVTSTGVHPEDATPTFKAQARVVSTRPFRIRASTAPSTVEKAVTPDFGDGH